MKPINDIAKIRGITSAQRERLSDIGAFAPVQKKRGDVALQRMGLITFDGNLVYPRYAPNGSVAYYDTSGRFLSNLRAKNPTSGKDVYYLQDLETGQYFYRGKPSIKMPPPYKSFYTAQDALIRLKKTAGKNWDLSNVKVISTDSNYRGNPVKKKTTRKKNPQRITDAQLKARLEVINDMLGRPQSWAKGHLTFDQAYGGYMLVELVSDGGAERNISGRMSKREMYEYMEGVIKGIQYHRGDYGKGSDFSGKETRGKNPVKPTNIFKFKKLKNGAEVLDQRGDIVLAKWKDNEYVTWTIDGDGNAYWGHYFPGDLSGAVANFEKRTSGRGRNPVRKKRAKKKRVTKKRASNPKGDPRKDYTPRKPFKIFKCKGKEVYWLKGFKIVGKGTYVPQWTLTRGDGHTYSKSDAKYTAEFAAKKVSGWQVGLATSKDTLTSIIKECSGKA